MHARARRSPARTHATHTRAPQAARIARHELGLDVPIIAISAEAVVDNECFTATQPKPVRAPIVAELVDRHARRRGSELPAVADRRASLPDDVTMDPLADSGNNYDVDGSKQKPNFSTDGVADAAAVAGA